MHRRGHVGVAMLAYAPVGFYLLGERRLGLALLGLLGVLAVEPLPDNDMWIPGLNHRGTSHSLFAALVVGTVLGALGWLAGDQLGAFLAGLGPSAVGPFAGVFEIVGEQLGGLDANALSTFGFAVGFFGICVHLLADALTVSGIRPFLPLSRWRLSLSRLRADNSLANNALFGVGIVVLVLVAFVTAPVGIAVPANLSPADVAAGQTTAENQTNATVELDNTNNTTAETVVVSEVSVPDGGFVVIHGEGYAEGGILEGSEIAISEPLEPGVHRNVSIPVEQGVPGASSNSSQLNSTRANLTTIAYQDTNDNAVFEHVTSGGQNDTPYQTQSGATVADTELVEIEENIEEASQRAQTEPGAVRFADQQVRRTDGTPAVTVGNATLPRGGFVVVHNGSYQPPARDPLNSAVGLSRYLEPGTYTNITVSLLNESVTSTQTLVAVPYQDTNGNQTYDYITSDGATDTAYLNPDQSAIANDTATVSPAPGSAAGTPTTTTTETSGWGDTDATGENPANTSTPFRITNLSVSNRTARVDDDINVTAQVENPTESRLEDELALATAGETATTEDVALFPDERRTVTFEHSYDSAGEYTIKVGNRTAQIRVVEEGAPLTTAAPAANASAQGESGEAMGLTSPPVIAAVLVLLIGIGWVIKRRRDQNDF